MRHPVPGGALLSGALLLLLLIWRAGSGAIVPLYDGLALPPDPYRYLQPQTAAQRAAGAAAGASERLPVHGPTSPYINVSTTERPPQAHLIIDVGNLHIPSGAQTLTARVVPVAPRSLPAGLTQDGNVYAIAVTGANGAPVPLRSGGVASIELRSTRHTGISTMYQYAGGSWTRLTTSHFMGTDIFFANVTSLGDFALFVPGSTSPVGHSPALVALGAAVLLLLAGIALLGRALRRRAVA